MDFSYEKKEVILKVENVSLTFGDTTILKNVNFEIKDIVRPNMIQGQIIGLLAPSGVGKTKLLEIISGTMPINDENVVGNILIGSNLEKLKIGDVGLVQQNYPLFEHRTVMSNLDVAARKKYSDKKTRHEKIDDLLTEFDLFKRKNYYPAQLSGGQRQRVCLLQQTLCSNNFLLMDEPFSSLDINMIDKAQKLILKISNFNELNTTIISSHDIVAISAISDTLLLLGRDRDAKGNIIPGAYIKKQYDLIELGFAWQENIEAKPEFGQFVAHLKQEFRLL